MSNNVCETHIVSNCQLCAKQKPSPLLIASPAVPGTSTNVPNLGAPAPQPPPVISSDPHAAKVLAAANKYAQHCDTFKNISDEIKTLETQMTDAKKRAANVSILKDTAQAELVKLMGEKA